MTTNDSSAKVARRRNERTCAGCGTHALAEELVRVVFDPGSAEVAVDLAGKMGAPGFGRGAHVHPSPDCVTKAFRGGFARVFKCNVIGDPKALGDAIVRAADRRIEGLLAGARRAAQLAVGSDVVAAAWNENRAELLVADGDAAAAAKLPQVERAIASGKAIAFGDKQRLGSLTARSVGQSENGEVAVIAILHPGVAAAVAQTYRMSGTFRGAQGSAPPVAVGVRSEEAWSSSEVR